MAKLPPQTLNTIFGLLQRLVTLVDETKSSEFRLFESVGETAETLPELEQLQNAVERLRQSYTRLHSLALTIAEAQPLASVAMLDLLDRSILEASATANAVEATNRETKQIWNLP
jgi:flagellar capping protein FliD